MSDSASPTSFQSGASAESVANDNSPSVIVPILASEEHRRRSMSNISLKLDPIEESFNWELKKFHEKTLWPIWITYLFQLSIGLLLIFVPLLLDHFHVIPVKYSFLDNIGKVPPKNTLVSTKWIVECIKGSILLGSTYSTYILIKLSIYLVPYFMIVLDKISKRDLLIEFKHKIEHFLVLRKYFSIAIAFTMQSIVANLIYSQTNNLNQILGGGGGMGAANDNKSPDSQSKIEEAALNVIWAQAIEQLSNYSLDFYVVRGSYALAMIALIILIEKLLIQAILIKFHNQAYSSRISDNNFAVKIIKKLLRTAPPHTELVTPSQKADYIFVKITGIEMENMENGNNIQIGRSDFAPFLSVQDSSRFWTIIDQEDIGDFSREFFKKAIKQLYYDRLSLNHGTLDHAQIIDKLDWLLMIIFSFLALLITMILLNLPTRLVFNTIVPILTALGFIFNTSLVSTFESLIFVIFTHPFDVGDSIMIEEVQYVVKELGFWSSTFIGPGHRLTIISNLKLRSLPIVNLRRSPHQIELVQLQVLPSVPRSKIEELERKLNDWVRENKHDYQPKICVNKFRIQDKNHMLLEIPLIHRGNFHNLELKEKRTKNFVYRLREVMAECDIDIAPPYW